MKKYVVSILCSFTFLTFPNNADGQVYFNKNDSIIVLASNGDTLENPWAGGFNSVQFGELDLNLDGIMDLVVFDRTGNKLTTYLNSGEANKVSYTHTSQYQKKFPKLTNWVLFRDYNCDGMMDFFTNSSGGMAAWRNTSTTTLNFTIDTSLVYSDYQPDTTPSYVNLYISSTDIPAIDDIDGDGDLDVLTFSIMGSYIEYHKNLSMEKYGDCSALDFQLSNKCWGFIKEALSGNTIILDDTCAFNINNPERLSGGNKHSGSVLFTLDVNADNAKDLVLSDVSFNNFTLLINQDVSPNLTHSSMISLDSLFPKNNSNTIAVDMDIFPAGFYMDVNNDNVKDLIAAPNCFNGCANTDNVWFYQNNGANNNPDFNFVQKNFIQDGMIEVGEGAHPVFFDYNADGLLDIVVGSYGDYQPSVGSLLYYSGLWVYENIGTANTPYYQWVDTNYAEIATMNLDLTNNRPTLGLVPAFGDLDADGDEDMILGDYNGVVHLFTNNAGAGNPASFSLSQVEYLGIDVGQNAAPTIYDVDNDGLLDLIIGNHFGTFTYYENKGTLTTPNFVFKTDSLGKVTTRNYYNPRGNSNPVFVDSSGTTILYSGSYNGYIYKFTNIDGNLTGKFNRDSTYLDIWEGSNSFITIADVTNDANLDMIVGNYSGGISFYKGDTAEIQVSVPTHLLKTEDIKVYPNPTTGLITAEWNNWGEDNYELLITNMLGKTIFYQKINTTKTQINIRNFPSGLYFLKLTGAKISKVVKIMKK